MPTTVLRAWLHRALDAGAALVDRPIVTNSRLRTVDVMLLCWFTLLTTATIAFPLIVGTKDPPGIDSFIYTDALRTLLAGGDPWYVSVSDITFAAPPPSLLPFLPFLLVPRDLVGTVGIGVAFAAAVYAVRRLRLPFWWLMFPPLSLAIAAGSSAPLMLALLVRGGVVADAAAVVTRVYAGLPLVALGRWRGLLIGAVAIVVTAPFLGWPTYIADRDHVAAVIADQANGGVSAAALPWLLPVAAVLLILLGRRRGAWLLVPALWPGTQSYYASISLPVLVDAPVAAMFLAFQLGPWTLIAGLGGQVLADFLARIRR